MIKVEKIDVWGFEHAVRGMRNPLNSWGRSDSGVCPGGDDFSDCTSTCEKCPRSDDNFVQDVFCIGKADMDLMQKLYKAGSEHRKYLRQVFCSMDITAPLYWWKEFDTYKVGTTANSCSTMHKIHDKKFTLDDFSHEHLQHAEQRAMGTVIELLNCDRELYLETKNKDYWWQLIQMLPSSYNQKRTITMNYENVMNIINQRTGHKLDEWNEFAEILKGLPYVKEIRGEYGTEERKDD